MSFDKVHSKRLSMLADHLEKGVLGHKRFDIGTFNNSGYPICGTAGCAIGECPILFPKDWRFSNLGNPALYWESTGHPYIGARLFFALTSYEASHLFYILGQDTDKYGGKMLLADATRYEVAANIRAFLEYKAKEMENVHV